MSAWRRGRKAPILLDDEPYENKELILLRKV